MVDMDEEGGKATVRGKVESDILIETLHKKFRKHAVLELEVSKNMQLHQLKGLKLSYREDKKLQF